MVSSTLGKAHARHESWTTFIGKFWDSEVESHVETDDLVTNEILQLEACPVNSGKDLHPASIDPRQRSADPSANPGINPVAMRNTPRPVKAPWTKMWKGPLPRRRVTPATTLGDILSMESRASGRRRGFTVGGDPQSSGIQITNRPPTGSHPGPSILSRLGDPTRARLKSSLDSLDADNIQVSTILKPKRRLVNIHLAPTAATALRLSFRDALMAGSFGRRSRDHLH